MKALTTITLDETDTEADIERSRSAALRVCEAAKDAEDARYLLSVLGLLEEPV